MTSGRSRLSLASLPPASGAVVMGTGAVSTSLILDDRSPLADPLLWFGLTTRVALAAWAVVLVATLARIVAFTRAPGPEHPRAAR